jgi:hypothetical protein
VCGPGLLSLSDICCCYLILAHRPVVARTGNSAKAVPPSTDAQSPSISPSAASTLAPLPTLRYHHLQAPTARPLCAEAPSPTTTSAARHNIDIGHPARSAHARHQTTLGTRERAHTTAVCRPSRSRSLVHPHLHAHRGARLRVCSQPWRSTSRTRTLHPRPRDQWTGAIVNCRAACAMGAIYLSRRLAWKPDLRCVAPAVSCLYWVSHSLTCFAFQYLPARPVLSHP